ncbi:hypothetical protein [Actinoplanes sp. ATCC 53533]|uniref:hypothetical protein n=1 Tax=Actinoplanes sp. ATCC 53533 TaxID=1288362 RepID=UPI0013155859|nr:hypothetical protein [Actinoplanes sp. ATCC 53533]
MKQFTGAAAAATAGLLLFAAPAQAAPSAEADVVEPTKARASAAEIAANNAEVWASLPPNVTMTVIGKMPELRGPIDHYTQDGPTITTGLTTLAVATLPYSYTFDGVRNLDGREFRSTRTKICKDIEVTWDYPVGSHHKFKVTLRGSSVTVPTDGEARSYCWSGVPTNTTMQFNYASTNNTSGDFAFASGSGQVRYP